MPGCLQIILGVEESHQFELYRTVYVGISCCYYSTTVLYFNLRPLHAES